MLPPYLNFSRLYSIYHKDLKDIFTVKSELSEKSKSIIKRTMASLKSEPSALIGIHVRANVDYRSHLKSFNAKPVGHDYYREAIFYFKEMYDNPLFLVVGDSKKAAFKYVIHPLQTLSK